MGYLTDNTPPTRNWVICQELYPFRIVIEPGFATDVELQLLVKDVVPDVEEWQYSGRRRCPLPAGKLSRVIHPAAYAQNSRKMRQFIEMVVFAFHLESDRMAVAARLTSQGFKFTIEDEPTPMGSGTIVIVVP